MQEVSTVEILLAMQPSSRKLCFGISDLYPEVIEFALSLCDLKCPVHRWSAAFRERW